LGDIFEKNAPNAKNIAQMIWSHCRRRIEGLIYKKGGRVTRCNQCDQTLSEKNAQICQNIAQNGALHTNWNFCPKKF
jgi:hypothetical protein